MANTRAGVMDPRDIGRHIGQRAVVGLIERVGLAPGVPVWEFGRPCSWYPSGMHHCVGRLEAYEADGLLCVCGFAVALQIDEAKEAGRPMGPQDAVWARR